MVIPLPRSISFSPEMPHLKPTILETEKYYWITIKQKNTFESWKPVFFSAFLFLDETFCLKLTRTVCHRIPFCHYTTLLFASWRGLCVVKGVKSSVCIRFVKHNTGVIISQSTGPWEVFGYEEYCQHVRSIVGPSLLERCLVNENCL